MCLGFNMSSVILTHFLILCFTVLSPSASQESAYGLHAPSVHVSQVSPGGQGWSSGQSAGSYYHYHVPLVGQSSQYQPQTVQSTSSKHELLLWLLPLLLVGIGPALFLPFLLKLFLLPLGLSLLGLLIPLLMMGMMMMMMMMGGGMMMMPMRNQPTSVSTARALGQLILTNDWRTIAARIGKSLDGCPERIACEAGVSIFSGNWKFTDLKESVSTFDQLLSTAGKFSTLFRSTGTAFYHGVKFKECRQFTCDVGLDRPILSERQLNKTSAFKPENFYYHNVTGQQQTMTDPGKFVNTTAVPVVSP